MTGFDPRRARAKRPVPIWTDAFLRDTMHLSADEVGGYHLILYAMWGRPTCDVPDDDHKLARICRVSLRLWRGRIGPVLREFFASENGVIFSKRLREEAEYVEATLRAQSSRKRGDDKKGRAYALPEGTQLPSQEVAEKSDKLLESNESGQSADHPQEIRGPSYPTTQLPNSRKEGGGGRQTAREMLLEAMGLPVAGMTPSGRVFGNSSDMEEARRWADDLLLSVGAQIAVIRDVMAAKQDGPPKSFKYFTPAMQRAAADLARPKLEPSEGAYDDRGPPARNRDDARARAKAEKLQRIVAIGAAGGPVIPEW